jgi:hypothetical protein
MFLMLIKTLWIKYDIAIFMPPHTACSGQQLRRSGDAGALSGGGFTLTEGFWGGVPAKYTIFLPALLNVEDSQIIAVCLGWTLMILSYNYFLRVNGHCG